MRWDNGGNKKTGFGQSLTLCLVTWKENVVKEKDQCVLFILQQESFIFSLLQRYIQQHDEVELSALGMGTFSSNFLSLNYIFLCFMPKQEKDVFVFFFLFHWGKRKKTQNLIESDFLVLYIINYGLKISWMISNCNFL